MHPARKRLLAFGLVTTASFGAAGFLDTPTLPTRSEARPQPASTSESKEHAGASSLESFDLLKERGRPHSLSSGVRHVYHVDLKSGQLLRVIAQQKGIDVQLSLFDPANAPLLIIDSPNSKYGPEPILLVAGRSGSFSIVVTTDNDPPPNASYLIEMARVQPATKWDRQRASALESYYRARELSRRGADMKTKEKAFLAAEAALRRAGPWDLHAAAWSDLGKLYGRLGDWQKAAAANERAAQLFHRIGEKGQEARALHEMGENEEHIPDIGGTLRHWAQARNLARQAQDQRTEAMTLSSLGMFYAERADAWNAESCLREAIRLWEQCGDNDGEVSALMGLGLLYDNIGQNEKAQQVYRDALQKQKLSVSSRAIILTQMGNSYIYEGRPDLAFERFRQAQEVQRDRDSESEANILTGFGLTFAAIHKYRDALDPYQKALTIYQNRHDLRNQAILFLNIGWTLGVLNRYQESRQSFNHSLLLSRKLGNSLLEAGAFLGFAWVERSRGHLSEAQRQGEQALKLIESMRSGTEDQGARLSFFSGKQDVYDLLVNVLMDQYKRQGSPDLLARGLEISESARARALLDTLGERDRPSSDQVMGILKLKEIQQRVLDPETVLLEYSLGRASSYLWMVTQKEIKVFSLPDRRQIEMLARYAYQKLQRSHLPEEQDAARHAARELSHVLLGPVADQLGKRRLLIVPSGALQSISFAVLPDPAIQASGKTPRQAWPEPLMLRHEIIYAPSASVLAEIRRARAGRRPAKGLLAMLADPVFELDDQRFLRRNFKRRDMSDPVLGHLRRLPGSRREADAISSSLPAGDVLKAVGFEANRDLFIRGRVGDHKILHLATHTFYPADHPSLAAIVLSRFDEKGKARNGLLRINDIIGLDLLSDLVVLSSCSSALGENVLGEGTVGWSHAFLSAGASSVVTSVWDVEDESTAELMRNVYKNMFSGRRSPSQALREAQIAMWKDRRYSSPYFWGGFIAQGEWQNLLTSLNKNALGVSPQGGDLRSPSTKTNPLIGSLRKLREGAGGGYRRRF
jgi:CHAT domain-containing protein/Tfp pilus assembly protein PilF